MKQPHQPGRVCVNCGCGFGMRCAAHSTVRTISWGSYRDASVCGGCIDLPVRQVAARAEEQGYVRHKWVASIAELRRKVVGRESA